MSVRVYLSLGSNLDRETMIRGAVTALREEFGEIATSPVYDTISVGFEGNNFLNLVVGLDTDLELETLLASFREIEDRLGRDRSLPRYGNRLIDLDILTYGDAVISEGRVRIPRPEILEHAYVLRPLQDIAGDSVHPENGESFRSLWERMIPDASDLSAFELDLTQYRS